MSLCPFPCPARFGLAHPRLKLGKRNKHSKPSRSFCVFDRGHSFASTTVFRDGNFSCTVSRHNFRPRCSQSELCARHQPSARPYPAPTTPSAAYRPPPSSHKSSTPQTKPNTPTPQPKADLPNPPTRIQTSTKHTPALSSSLLHSHSYPTRYFTGCG